MIEQSVTISNNGRIVLPAMFRKQLDINPGDELIVSISADNDIIIHSPKQSLRKLQNIIAKKNKQNLVEQVIEMRRSEEV